MDKKTVIYFQSYFSNKQFGRSDFIAKRANSLISRRKKKIIIIKFAM